MSGTAPRAVLAVFAVLAFVTRALAGGSLPAAGSVAETETASHGWMVMQADSASPWMLLHIPPRKPDGGANAGELPSEAIAGPGLARFAGPIESIPLAIAAVSNELYMIFDTDTPGAQGFRRIFRVRAERDAISGMWRTLPLGRLEQVGAQPVDGDLLAFIGTARGPCAVVRSAGHTSVWLFVREEWREVIIPDAMKDALREAGDVTACAGREGLEVLVAPDVGGNWQIWRAELKWPSLAPTADERESVSTLWDSPRAPLPLEWTHEVVGALHIAGEHRLTLIRLGNELALSVWQQGAGLVLFRHDGNGDWIQCAAIPQAPEQTGVLGLTSVGRVFAAWRGASSDSDPVRLGWEVKVATGEVLHDGPLLLSGPISRTDYRLLMMLLLVITVSTLAFVLKPEDRASFHLPYGFSLAGSSRRLLAGSLDLAISLSVAHVVLRFATDDLGVLDPTRLNSIDLLGGGILCSFVMGVVSESLVGRTPGKLLLGIQVIAVTTAHDGEIWALRPSVPKVLIRNALKWTAFPLSLLGLIDSDGRGRPDQLAGTVVVIRDSDEVEDDGAP